MRRKSRVAIQGWLAALALLTALGLSLPSVADAAWQRSVTVSPVGTQYSYGQDVSPAGDGVTVWSAPLDGELGFGIYSRELDSAGDLGPVRQISATPAASVPYTSAYRPAVRFAADGTATIVWLETIYGSESCFAEPEGEDGEDCEVDEYVRTRQIAADGSLSPIRDLHHNHAVYPADGSFGGGSASYVAYGQPLIAGGPGDTLTVLWAEAGFGSECSAYGYSSFYADSDCEADASIVWRRLADDGVPSSPAAVATSTHTTGYGSGTPLVRMRAASGPDGAVTVVFSARVNDEEAGCWGGESAIQTLRIAPDGTSLPAEQLDSGCGASEPALATDAAGAAIVAWGWEGTYSADEALYARIATDGTAGAPEPLLDEYGEGGIEGLDLSRGLAGSVVAVWSESGAIHLRQLPPEGAPGEIRTVAEPGEGGFLSSPRIALSNDGSGAVVWEAAAHEGNYETAVQGVEIAADGSPGQRRVLQAPQRWDHGARIAAGSGGALMASWRLAVPGKNRIQAARLSADAAVGNDDFADAEELAPELPSFAAGSNEGASREGAEPEHAGGPGSRSVWYSWTASESGPVSVSTCTSGGIDSLLAVYTGEGLGSLEPVASADGAGGAPCDAGDSKVRFQAEEGTTYRIAVDGKDGTTGGFGLRIRSRAAPSNDAFATARSLGSGNASWFDTNVDASDEPSEPDHGGEPGGASVWYSWTPFNDGETVISVCGSSLRHPVVAVYEGSSLGELTEVGAAVGSGATGCSSGEVQFEAQPGTTYRIAVDGVGGSEGSFAVKVAQAPANDAFSDAQALSEFLPTSGFGSTWSASREEGEPRIDGEPGGSSVWYSWTPQQSGTAFASLCMSSSGKPALLGVYTGDELASLDEVAAVRGQSSKGGGCFGSLGEVNFAYVAGTTYRFAVDAVDGAQSSFNLSLESLPTNDDFADAQALGAALPQFASGSNRHASREEGEPQIDGDPGGSSLWYSWTPQQSGTAVASLCMSSSGGKQALLGVYTGGDIADLELVAAGRGQSSQSSGCFGSIAEVRFDYLAGTSYRLAVDGEGGAQSFFNLALGQIPSNDDFADAQPLSGTFPLNASGSNQYSSHEESEPSHGATAGTGSVWYSWTAPASGPVTVSACRQSSFGSVQLGVYTGDRLGSLSAVGAPAGSFIDCYGDTKALRIDAEAGIEYKIAVDGTQTGTSYSLQIDGRPDNDDFTDAQPISGSLPTWQSSSNAGAGRQSGEPQIAGDSGGASVWYSWTPQGSGTVRVSVCGNGALDPLLGVYTGDALGELAVIAQADAEPGAECGTASTVEFEFVAGTTYRIAVEGAGGSEGFFELELRGRPHNDDFADAQQISPSLPEFVSGDTRLASKQESEPDHAGDPGGASVWYSWTPSSSGPVGISTCSFSGIDPLLAVYTGSSLEDLTEVASNDGGGSDECSEGDSEVRFGADVDTTYWIAVDGRDGSQGRFSLDLSAPPANDDFSNAEMLGTELPLSRFGTNQLASKQDGEPDHAGNPGGASVWYSETAPVTASVEISVCGYGGLDPVLAVYTGPSLAELDEVTSDAGEESSSGCFGNGSEVQFEAQAGTAYWLAIDGRGGSEGNFELTLRPLRPENDDFADAIVVAQPRAAVSATTFGATTQAGEPSSWPPAESTVWFRWTAPTNGPVHLHTCAAGGNQMDINVFTGSSLGSLSMVSPLSAETSSSCALGLPASSGSTPIFAFQAKAGTTYSISVDSYFQTSPAFERMPPGPFVLAVGAPANDLRAMAERVPAAGATLARTNLGATAESGEDQHADQAGGGSVWFRWFASASGPVSIDTCGSEVDTLLAVYGPSGSGGGGSAEEEYSDDPPAPGGGGSAEEEYSDDPPPAPSGAIASSDDSELCGPDSTQSAVALEAQEGLEYLIAVDGKEGAAGPIELTLDFDTLDTTPPSTAAFVQSPWSTLQLLFSATLDEPESTLECRVGGAAFSPCTLTSGVAPFLSGQIQMPGEGVHAVEIREVDVSGNPDPTPAHFEVTVDMTPPETSIAAGAEGLTRFVPQYVVESDEEIGWLECSLDSAAFSSCSAPYLLNDLADGEHNFRVRARDLAGNVDPTPASRTFTLDRTPPVATIESGPQGTVEENHVSFEFSADEPASFKCWLDGHFQGDCEGPVSFSDLSDAEHRFEVEPTDTAGNVGELVERAFRVEARPPETTIPSGPSSPVASTTAKFQFAGDEELSGFECALDAVAFAACEQTHQFTGLADGMHTLEVRAIDLAGKRDLTPARYQWIVDTTPPQTTIESGPSGLTRHRGSFDFDANEPVVRFECAVDGGAFSNCFSGYELPPVPDGPHTLVVRAVDLAGNVDPVGAERNLTLDTVPPEVEIIDPPPPLTQSSVTIEFEVGEAGASTECRIDSHSSFPCTSPAEIEGLPDGPHTISVTATDQAGNVGTATTEEFTVDEQPPDTWITGAPALYTSERAPSIYFDGSEDTAEYRCSVDEGAFAACESPLELEDLAEGVHVVRVYAIDSVGHPDPTPDEVSFTVDTVPPDTTITDAPSGPVHALLVPFSFASSEPLGGFECAMDSGSFKSCAGIKHDGQLGEHLFEVRALDRAGNADPSPASHSFTFANQVPQASLSLDRSEGAAPLDVSATVGGSDGDGDELSYEVQFGDGESASGKLPHGQIAHTYEEPGVYVVRLAVDDGFERAVATETVTVGPPEPLDARAGDDRTVVAGDPVSFDAGDSRPLRGIGGYEWSFGDSATATGATPTHTYDEPGTYEAQLAVTRGEEESTDTATITVVPAAADQSTITVRGDGAPLEGAEVLVMPAGGSKLQALTDAVGRVRLRGLADGSYKFAAYKDGFLPAYGDLIVSGGSGVGEVNLQAGETASASVDSHPMTLDEIEAAGIDPNDPANQHVYQFEVHLNLKPPGQPTISRTVGGMINRDGFIGPGCVLTSTTDCLVGFGGGGGGGYGYIRTTWVPGLDAPLLSALVIPFRATFLKEFYDVSMVVSNLASPGFELRNGEASIELPSGMSLAPTAKSQSLDVEMPDIPGGGSAQTHWILRGDTEGEYDLAAHYGATLEPFGRSIKLDARTNEPIKVWGGSALQLEVDVDDEVRDRYPYTVFVKLKNVADVPVYNPAVELLKEGRVGYIEQPRQQRSFGVRELLPGHTHVAGPFIIVPEPSGEIDLQQSFIRKTAGDVNLGGTIITHERVPSFEETPGVEVRGYGDKLVLDWEPVAGATDYQVFRTIDRLVDFPDDPLSVDFLDPTRAVVRGINPDEHAYYGISSLLNPREMVHPLTFGTGEMNREWPKLAIDAGQRCDSRDMAVDLRFEALDFELASYEMTLNDLPFGSSQPLSGYSDSATVHVPFATGEEDTDFEVTVRDVEGTGRTEHANLACDYVALGDSYSSGEGVPTDGTVTDPGDFLGPTQKNPNDSNQNGCHRSRIAYPRLVKANGQRAVVGDRLMFHACSGAVLDDMWADGKEMRQINRVDEGAELVTLSIGGNDMHFADIIKACVSNQITLDPTCRNDHKTELEDGYQEVQEKLPQLLRQIRQRAPGARILVVAYPQIFPSFPYDPLDLLSGGLLFSCNTFGLDNVNPWDILWLSDMQKRAAEMIEEAVSSSGSGAEYVSMGNRFNGHDVCQEFDPWFNGPVLPPSVVYSFHPNVQGQEAMADAVLQKLGQPRPESFFQIHPGEFIDRAINVVGGGGGRAAKAIFSQYWPGSDVELTLESPSGRVIGRDTDAEDIEHELGPTFETYVVREPEEGEWKMRFEGVDVATGGEKVTYEATTATEENLPPVAQFNQSLDGVRPGLPVSFDASGSSDADGEIIDYEWNFDDGEDASGQTVQHSFAVPGRYEVRLLVRDEDGAAGVFAQREIWVRNAPTAVDDRYEVAPSAELGVGVGVGLLANDTVDRAGGEPELQVIGGVAHGTLDLSTDGSFHYRPDAGFSGTDTMSYKLSDAGGFVSAPAIVRIDVRSASVDPGTLDPGPSGADGSSAAGPSAQPPTNPQRKSKSRKCRKGLKKKKVRGKTRCVKVKTRSKKKR